MIKKSFDKIDLKIFETREEMGNHAAREAKELLLNLLNNKEEVNLIFAAAPSQNEFLHALSSYREIAWDRVNAFHMDEYVGLKIGSESSFSGFLKKGIMDKVPLKSKHFINGLNPPDEECSRYADILKAYPTDIVFMGIGENGHIAFNDPGAADFHDPLTVKVVELDEVSRNQQVHDGCFATLDQVPRKAITVTIPILVSAENIFCIVPNKEKAQAVKRTLEGEVSEDCPASILRQTDGVKMYIDAEAASLL